MASPDQREFEKYLKFFSLKSIQIVVQSRKGELLRTSSRSTATDWFGLALPDDKTVQAELKRASQSKMPQEGAPLCVEISLKSPENDSTIIVENWSMSLDTSKIDPSARATAVVYPKMGVILKSLLCVSRLLPACGLSRQLYDDWHICYRIMTGPLDKSSLGPDPESVEIGHCGSQCGRLSLSVDYRKTIDTFQRLEEGNEESVTFLHEELDGGQATRHLPGRPIPFANQGLYNDEEIESIQVQHFSQVMKYEKQTSLAPSLTPSLTPQVSGSPLNETSSIQVRKTSPALRDEFIHLNVTVKPAFASECSPNNNIGQFFEECRNPPSLDMFRSSNIVDINTALQEDLSLST